MVFGSVGIGQIYDAGRTPPMTAACDLEAAAIVQIASGKNWFGVTQQEVKSGEKYSLAREGIFRSAAESTLVLALGAKVPVTVGTGGVCSIAAHAAGDPLYFCGRCTKAKASGKTQVEWELIDFDDPEISSSSSS